MRRASLVYEQYKNFSVRRRAGRQKGRGLGGRNFCLLAPALLKGLDTAPEKGSCALEGSLLKSPFSEPFNVSFSFWICELNLVRQL